MDAQPLLFDAVVFDLDGTLVATDRFWVDAARAGARRAMRDLELDFELPSAAGWMTVVGLPLAQGFERLFPALEPAARAHLLACCVEEEERALRAGGAALLPGVAAVLDDLRARGLRLGIASNCGRGYLETMLNELGLVRWVEAARCLDSPGVRSKAGMVAQLLEHFGTRSALMVGDRLGDRDAAWENGLPHVHFARGFAPAGEEVPAEAVIEEIGALVPRLLGRTRWIAQALSQLGFDDQPAPRSLAVTGHSGSGKSLFAQDVVRVLAARGQGAKTVALDDFLRPELTEQDLSSTAFASSDRPLEHLTQAFDVDLLIKSVIEPHARGQAVRLEQRGTRIEIAPGEVLVLQGLFLLHPLLRGRLERTLFLSASDSLCLRRVAGRDARLGPEALLRVRRSFLPVQRGFDQLADPQQFADLVLDGENALGPDGVL